MTNDIAAHMDGYLAIAKRDPALAAAAIIAGVSQVFPVRSPAVAQARITPAKS